MTGTTLGILIVIIAYILMMVGIGIWSSWLILIVSMIFYPFF